MTDFTQQQADKVAISEVIYRERSARDSRDWATMRKYWHEDSSVDISWFKGTGPEFIAATQKQAAGVVMGKIYSFHQLEPAIVTVNGDIALAETGYTGHGFQPIDGVDVDLVVYGRLLWRMRRSGDEWLIAGFRAIYIRDEIIPVIPGLVPDIDRDVLAGLRESYCLKAYIVEKAGRPMPDDLPGVDRPDLVEAVLAEEQEWLSKD